MTAIDRWLAENEPEYGHYAVLAGFEKEIQKIEDLQEIYDDLGIDLQLKLFSFIVALIEEK